MSREITYVGRRVALVCVADDLLLKVLRDGLNACSVGVRIPEDAVLIAVDHHPRDCFLRPGTIELYLESPTFAPVQAATGVPEIDVLFKRRESAFEMLSPIGSEAYN